MELVGAMHCIFSASLFKYGCISGGLIGEWFGVWE